MSNILTFTKAAFDHIQGMQKSDPTKPCFRLWVKRTGCSGWMYMPEMVAAAKNEDLQWQEQGLSIAVDPEARPLIEGTEVDFIQTGFQKQMQFKNPNIESHCGCGESFNVPE